MLISVPTTHAVVKGKLEFCIYLEEDSLYTLIFLFFFLASLVFLQLHSNVDTRIRRWTGDGLESAAPGSCTYMARHTYVHRLHATRCIEDEYEVSPAFSSQLQQFSNA